MRRNGRGIRPDNTVPVERKLTFTIPGEPMGAPRMTQRDRWKKRPVVLRYWAWKDLARLSAGTLPPVESILSLSWKATFTPPKSWSKKKRSSAIGQLHRSKPDRDNIDKACLDALFEQDSAVAAGYLDKRWGETPCLEVEIVYRTT